jgi:nitrous oxidase accessory protein NosD
MMNRIANGISLVTGLLLLAAAPVWATNYFVPGTHATIQGALTAASAGDAVMVSAGTYTEILVLKSGVLLQGAGPELTILDGGGLATVLFIQGQATSDTRVEGFTIRNGSSRYGGGIFIQADGTPTITNCLVEGCTASLRGGGIYVSDDASPVIEFCQIEGNDADQGGGIYAQTGSPEIRWNVICHNEARVGGGAHLAFCSSVTIENNSFAGNSAEEFGSGLSLGTVSGSVRNNIIALNLGAPGYYAVDSSLDSDCNIVWGNPQGDYFGVTPGPNSLSVDPMFCDEENCDLSLSGSSPALDADGCGLIGALTVGCDETSTENTTWGQIKSKYR